MNSHTHQLCSRGWRGPPYEKTRFRLTTTMEHRDRPATMDALMHNHATAPGHGRTVAGCPRHAGQRRRFGSSQTHAATLHAAGGRWFSPARALAGDQRTDYTKDRYRRFARVSSVHGKPSTTTVANATTLNTSRAGPLNASTRMMSDRPAHAIHTV